MVEEIAGLPINGDGTMMPSQDPLQHDLPAQQLLADPTRRATVPVSRPKMSVFQPTAAGAVARHIMQKGGSQTLAPERPPSFVNASFLDIDRSKFKIPTQINQSNFYAQQALGAQKLSSLAARPGNKRMPSQTLGPEFQKRMPPSVESPLGTSFLPNQYFPPGQQSHPRRFSVPGWIGGNHDLVDNDNLFLQAAFPGTMPVPEFTPTQNNPGFVFPVSNAS